MLLIKVTGFERLRPEIATIAAICIVVISVFPVALTAADYIRLVMIVALALTVAVIIL
ncbi:MAG: hypothetical protein ACJA2Q_000777 [Pseudohongiellaceae bacterium]